MPTAPSPRRGLLVTKDILFASKVTGTAAALGLKVEIEADPARAPRRAEDEGHTCLILDLATPGLVVAELMAALPPESRPRVIAYGSHVNTVALEAAKNAGCDEVLPRSRFSAQLPKILQTHLQ